MDWYAISTKTSQMKLIAHPYLFEIDNYKPGKARVENQKVIKLSSNENALGASPKAIEAYKNYVEQVFRYADGSCCDLRNSIADKNGIDAERIVCGAGSDEILAFLTAAFAKAGDEIIYSQYGFLMYPISAKRVGAKAIAVKENNLKSDVEAILASITKRTKIIFIANPNNPTGSYLNKAQIEKLINGVPKNILIVLDNAYEEFVDEADYPNAIELVNSNENVVMTRTFSKIYGLASLRIGWCYSSKYVSEVLNKVRGPFNVGGPAQVAAIAALQDDDFFEASKNHNKKWLKILFAEFAKIDGLKTYPSIANFILLDFGNSEICQKVNESLLKKGVIFREMTAYGLPTCLRMSIGTDEENLVALQLIKDFFS